MARSHTGIVRDHRERRAAWRRLCRSMRVSRRRGHRRPALPVERDDDLVAVHLHVVAAHAQSLVRKSAARRDVELPLVPGAPTIPFVCRGRPPRRDFDCRRDGSCAERCAAVGTAVGKREEGVPDSVEADAVAADLDDPNATLDGASPRGRRTSRAGALTRARLPARAAGRIPRRCASGRCRATRREADGASARARRSPSAGSRSRT